MKSRRLRILLGAALAVLAFSAFDVQSAEAGNRRHGRRYGSHHARYYPSYGHGYRHNRGYGIDVRIGRGHRGYGYGSSYGHGYGRGYGRGHGYGGGYGYAPSYRYRGGFCY